MSLRDAVTAAGSIPHIDAAQSLKKRYSELLSAHLAVEVAEGLQRVSFPRVRPVRGGPGERAFQGGLGPKKVDVSYSDEQHGLLLAVSIKTITAVPYGKNLKNRFADLCTEAITLHMRFPYSVVCALFAFPVDADEDITAGRPMSTFQRATRLFATISGRREYTDPGEKFEDVTMMLFQPVGSEGESPYVRLFDAISRDELTERAYFLRLRSIYNYRNPHAVIGEGFVDGDDDS
ncbi:MAG TPA: hypothetical protein VNL77_24400 [Roseiflexaceae bacterium]|nr:hypothetical protein [Roseiflexaceae bacterium]